MTSSSPTTVISIITLIFYLTPTVHTLGGSAATISITYGSNTTICGIVAGQPSQPIQCWTNGHLFNIYSNISFQSIAGGRNILCGIRSTGSVLMCWNPNHYPNPTPKRLYYNQTVTLSQLVIGDTQICAINNNTKSNVDCWRDRETFSIQNGRFRSISSGLGFTCGVTLDNAEGIICFGVNSEVVSYIQGQFSNFRMLNIVVGGDHACGVNVYGYLICRGNNDYGKIDVPDHLQFEFSGLALGLNHTCALRINQSVVCWGSVGNVSDYFESIVAGLDFTCGLTTNNLSVMCWGEGWVRSESKLFGYEVPLRAVLPGPCVRSGCKCGTYIQSDSLCSGNGLICKPCDLSTNILAPPSPGSGSYEPRSLPSRSLRRGLLAFAIVGAVGAFAGVCTIIYCLWTGVCCGNKRIHNSVQPTINGAATHNASQLSNSSPVSRSSTIRRQASRAFRRQRSGTSSKHADREEEFTFDVLALATDNFSQENKIGAGSFGVVYKGKLLDGREVAIKRGETSQKAKKFQEKESAFDSELAFLSRLHHKHLVRLVGYCEEREEKLLVYEYMKNGALYDHLHDKKNVEKNSSVLNSWKMRIKIALDAARGIEYLHTYAVPPIIHRDIKSSNILLDANWVARVSDFGLSLMDSECEWAKILDTRVGPPDVNEAEAVELMAYTAIHCVNLEGKERPTMTDIVANLERAVSLCDHDSHGSISSGQISIISE
ncbi:hypothetical protein M8C21_022342 [Ambrosia artemisiifolia]|uniref:Protein kinase domain-containing protein n=1 Tax=Ambrosia artemisiifolia TaxID=4212 RepID=A0AAD5GGC9_AMBAR|nr:hypothetical protein M8C21_022342 [Ambrosia artemisiifolia]